jgi:uncharacterized protein (TIGR03086 family)
MGSDYLNLYRRASEWTGEKVKGASAQLDAQTPCDQWDVQTLLNHMLQTQRYFLASARGEEATPPMGEPPATLSDNPADDFESVRREVLDAFDDEDVQKKTGPALGIAFADALLHGWDLATATGQDATMPADLAAAAFDTVHGRFTDDQRQGVFKPEIAVGDDASPQARLLAYSGRHPEA